jgi:hypothetical protein
MRVLINREAVGRMLGLDYESHDRDFFAQGDCEDVVLNLMDELGWIDYLRPLLDNNGLPETSAQLLRDRFQAKDEAKTNIKGPYSSEGGNNGKQDEMTEAQGHRCLKGDEDVLNEQKQAAL